MRRSEFEEAVSGMPGIVRLNKLTDDVLREIGKFEFSAPANGFLPVDPVGFTDVACSPGRYALYFNEGLMHFEPEPFMDLVDSRGTVVGHDIVLSEKHLYDSPDYIWISDNMFFDMKKVAGLEMRCLIKSVRYRPGPIPEDVVAKVFFPCTSTVEYLLNHCGFGQDVSVVLMGVDGLER